MLKGKLYFIYTNVDNFLDFNTFQQVNKIPFCFSLIILTNFNQILHFLHFL